LYANRLKRRIFSNVITVRLILVVFCLLATVTIAVGGIRGISGLLVAGNPFLWKSIPQIDGKTNFLLLGFSGEGHSGGDLSDSIIFVSLNSISKQTVILSIPRDIWVPSIEGKINSAYRYGFEKNATSGGLLMSKSIISELVGERIHFVVSFDFSTLVNLVDSVGGITIDVNNTFDDFQYPILGKENDDCNGDPKFLCRYEHIRFESGVQHMDGRTALKYVRSRHSTDLAEGTDFARSKRQSNVISAIISRFMSVKFLTNIALLKQTYLLTTDSLISDIDNKYYPSILIESLKASRYKMKSYSLFDSGLLINPPDISLFDNQWVLTTSDGDFQKIRSYVDKIMSPTN
jgi:LCP family protein required for cell wall assembly